MSCKINKPRPCVQGRGKVHRVIDANLNRSREALRVCEDITRFVLDDKSLTKSIKDVRHKISGIADKLFEEAIKFRDTLADVGRQSSFDRHGQIDFKSLFYRNAHKAEEAIRALEEFSKLIAKKGSGTFFGNFKALRFKVYLIEKKAIKKLQTLCNS